MSVFMVVPAKRADGEHDMRSYNEGPRGYEGMALVAPEGELIADWQHAKIIEAKDAAAAAATVNHAPLALVHEFEVYDLKVVASLE